MKRKTLNKENMPFIKIVFRLLPAIFRACPIYVIMAGLVGALHGGSWAFITYMTQRFFDSVTENIKSGGIWGNTYLLLVALAAAIIIFDILNGLHNFMFVSLYKKLNGHIGVKKNEKAAKIDPIAFEDPGLLDDINKAGQGMINSNSLIMTMMDTFTFYVAYFLFMGVFLYSLKPVLAISLVFIFIPVVFTQLVRVRFFSTLEDEAAPIRREYEYYEKCICDREYFKETRLLGAFNYFKDLYLAAANLLGKKIWSTEARTGLMELGTKILTLLGYMGILYLLFHALLNGEITIGAFGAIFASIWTMFNIMEEIICQRLADMTHDLGTVRNFIRFLDIPERNGKDCVLNGDMGISIKNVSFHYPGAETDSISNVSLDIEPGETIAIVGENGAGKSTLVKLLTGLYLPNEGSVKIGGLDTKEVSAEAIYKGISGVFQKYQRYKMTLSENISISSMKCQESNNMQILKAADKAALEADHEGFPQGFDTMLSREFEGVDLSGGQWQRVAIARGFYRSHKIIVLDEPTAAIDPIEETNVYNKFAGISKGKTSVIITHRLGSARIAHRIVVMDKGSIIEIGTHEELMKNRGKYAEMFSAQSQWYGFLPHQISESPVGEN